MPSLKHHGQMSEAFITALFLSVSGGLQDVYTYLFRGKVFANAQTGNIVLMSVHAFAGEWGEALRYLVPLCAFALGIFAAEFIRLKLREMQWLHWRQLVVLFEILLLFVVGFLPQELNLLANSLVSFSCAMQVQSFRKVNGYAFASTMCIGNLRSGMDSLCAWLVGGSTKAFGKALLPHVPQGGHRGAGAAGTDGNPQKIIAPEPLVCYTIKCLCDSPACRTTGVPELKL